MGHVNPFPYILFVLLYPVKNNRTLFLLLSFIFGLFVDLFSNSGGVHAAACVTIAYIRPGLLKFCFGMLYEHQSIKFNQTDLTNRLLYFSVLTVCHHLILFSNVIMILQKSLFSSIFTILLCFLFTVLFSSKQR
jgi:rod shape-determining protein MreD